MKRDPELPLGRYNEMRDFGVTEEPSGKVTHTKTKHEFVVQKHHASHLHYDFRLELDGVLLSWAVPKGPSLSPKEKRLAVQVEDHPVDYRNFEGTIPAGEYGGGAVIVWDRGTWTPAGDPHEGMKKGRLDFELEGEKLHGRWVLVRTKGLPKAKKPSWLLIKRTDEHVANVDIVEARPESVISGRTIEDIENDVPAEPPHRPVGKPRKPKGARLPAFGSVKPQLATLVNDVPTSGDWIYEIKFDGYRTMAWLDDGAVKLASRKGLDWTGKYAAVAEALAHVRAKNAIFDGEIAYVLDDGRTSFQKLQNTLGSSDAKEHGRLVYFVFDLLFYDGVDLTREPLATRKEKLRTILAGEKPPLKLSDDVKDGDAFFREACKLDLEGIIGKRADLPYHAGRNADWIKVKCQKRQELVIVGFTPPKGGRKGIGALLLGVHDGDVFRYAGKVGTGFSNATLAELAEKLGKLVVDEPPVVNAPRMKAATWVKPKLVAEVRFSEWTSDGALRHPTFEGLRIDKGPSEVVKEVERPTPHVARKKAQDEAKPRVHEIVISHPERVMDLDTGLTKLDLANYIGAVGDTMLPYVKQRPLMLLRCPAGTKTKCFVQKHAVQSEEAISVATTKELVELAQNNTVEIHGWGSRFPKSDRPDWIVLDLDPDEALPFSKVIDAAFEVKAALETLSLDSWVKTTGGKGLHVVVPILRKYDWATVKRASQRIAELLAQAAPDRYVATMGKKHRIGKIFIDYLRNGEGATAVLPYSPRARPGLPVAVPFAWKDLRAVDPTTLTIQTVPALIAKRKTDPWADLLTTHQTLPKELLAV